MSPQRTFSSMVALLSLTTGCVEHICDSQESGCKLGSVELLQARVARDDPGSQQIQITLNSSKLSETSEYFADSIPVTLRQNAITRSAVLTKSQVPYVYNINFSDYVGYFNNGTVNIERDELGALPSIYVYLKAALAKTVKKEFNVSTSPVPNFAPFKLSLAGPTMAPGDKAGDQYLLAFSHTTADRFEDSAGARMFKYLLPAPSATANSFTLGGVTQGFFGYDTQPGAALETSYYLEDTKTLNFKIAQPVGGNVGVFNLYSCLDLNAKVNCASQQTVVDSSVVSTAGQTYRYRHLNVDTKGQLTVVGGKTGSLDLYSNTADIVNQKIATGRLQAVAVDYFGTASPDIVTVDEQKNLVLYRLADKMYQTPISLVNLSEVFSPVPATGSVSLAVGDVNGDTLPDLAIAWGREIRFLINQGTPTPSFKQQAGLDPGSVYKSSKYDILAITMRDLDGDRLADTIISEANTTSSLADSLIEIFYTNNPTTITSSP